MLRPSNSRRHTLLASQRAERKSGSHWCMLIATLYTGEEWAVNGWERIHERIIPHNPNAINIISPIPAPIFYLKVNN